MLVDLPGGGSMLQRVTLAARVNARLRVAALDRALAGGAVPDSEVALTLHARRLISPAVRRQLARALRGVAESSRRPSLPPARWPGTHVASASSDLLALAEHLESAAVVDARGVARVRVLLSDAGGPLHFSGDAHRLVLAAREAVAALDPYASGRT